MEISVMFVNNLCYAAAKTRSGHPERVFESALEMRFVEENDTIRLATESDQDESRLIEMSADARDGDIEFTLTSNAAVLNKHPLDLIFDRLLSALFETIIETATRSEGESEGELDAPRGVYVGNASLEWMKPYFASVACADPLESGIRYALPGGADSPRTGDFVIGVNNLGADGAFEAELRAFDEGGGVFLIQPEDIINGNGFRAPKELLRWVMLHPRFNFNFNNPASDASKTPLVITGTAGVDEHEVKAQFSHLAHLCRIEVVNPEKLTLGALMPPFLSTKAMWAWAERILEGGELEAAVALWQNRLSTIMDMFMDTDQYRRRLINALASRGESKLLDLATTLTYDAKEEASAQAIYYARQAENTNNFLSKLEAAILAYSRCPSYKDFLMEIADDSPDSPDSWGQVVEDARRTWQSEPTTTIDIEAICSWEFPRPPIDRADTNALVKKYMAMAQATPLNQIENQIEEALKKDVKQLYISSYITWVSDLIANLLTPRNLTSTADLGYSLEWLMRVQLPPEVDYKDLEIEAELESVAIERDPANWKEKFKAYFGKKYYRVNLNRFPTYKVLSAVCIRSYKMMGYLGYYQEQGVVLDNFEDWDEFFSNEISERRESKQKFYHWMANQDALASDISEILKKFWETQKQK